MNAGEQGGRIASNVISQDLNNPPRRTPTQGHGDGVTHGPGPGNLATTLGRALADQPLLVDAAVVRHALREVIAASQSLHAARTVARTTKGPR